MQRYSRGDPYEREPLSVSSHEFNTFPTNDSRHLDGDSYTSPDPLNPSSASSGRMHPLPPQQQQLEEQPPQYQPRQSFTERDASSYISYVDDGLGEDPVPPPHPPSPPPPPPPLHGADFSRSPRSQPYAQHVAQSNITPGADNFGQDAAGGVAGIAYSVADQNTRRTGAGAWTASTGQLPPPPSRAQYQNASAAGYAHESLPGRGFGQQQVPEQGFSSRSSLNPFGTPSATQSPARSMQSFGAESYADDPYQGLSSSHRYCDASLGVVNPLEIADDGDDGLHYGRQNQRDSMLSLSQPDNNRPGVVSALAAGSASGRGGRTRAAVDGKSDSDREKSDNWISSRNRARSKKWKWAVIILVFLAVAGAIIGGVVGSMIAGNKKQGGADGSQSAADDYTKNGDLDIGSSEIKALMNNKDLHKVFAGIDYTPLNTQYPDCMHNPPSQNNITRDVAVLSQLTNKIRLYGTDCNQTQMLIHALDRLHLNKDVKIWLGVWQDKNETTNARQLAQMWDILDQYGSDPFEGIIVANEILFRKDMTVAQLGTVLDGVRSNLTAKGINLPVASSDLGDDWTASLAAKSDYIMANIHPFFAGINADKAATWTYDFWTGKDKQFWKADSSKNIISETGWPSEGGKNCGESPVCTSSTAGAVASIDGLNTFMEDWVCQALANGTNYFWFEAFDEPWKIRFNEDDKNWEDKWGLMDVNRKLKPGLKIPDCGGKTV